MNILRIRLLTIHIYKCWKNNRSVSKVLADFAVSALPFLLWLILFNSVNMIPNNVKPRINVRLLLRLDDYIFNNFMGIISCIILTNLISLGLFNKFYKETFSSIDYTKFNLPLTIVPKRSRKYTRSSTKVAGDLLLHNLPLIFISFSWFILKIVFSFKEPITKFKNLLALIFFIMGHFLILPITIYYLYLFQYPGVLKRFIIILGLQNLIIVLIHIFFPNVPPIYIQYYGENKIPSYESPGYSEGLTRIDINPFVQYIILYVKSIEFGILPSLHSSISLLITFFLCYLIKSIMVRVGIVIYLLLQIWSSLYLDHHWKFDILVSIIFSSGFFLLIKSDLDNLKTNFLHNYKLNYNGSTMGMRLFKGTKFESLFNPL
ncbi:hypothetical protein CLIB1444_05S04148 [[Candida] jaroonii]|uniref:Uncharacterized protein n=1 Tax=[Candida] jaroonii TaxID=467808 RepID=A0ACA9Y7X8_9ASCO|nr:hypothetical protein CLIB1444_05S04148 [[Candida] jaroonii]